MPETAPPQKLKRSLTLLLAVLYGPGVTIGAGIYVLVGLAAGRSGMHAPLAFVLAAMIMSFIVAATTLLALSVLGGLGASVGGAGIIKGAIRVTFWGALAMALTAGIGALFGTVV